MDKLTIVEDTLANGGGTWGFRGGIHTVEFTDGYMVALAGREYIVPVDSLDYAPDSGFSTSSVEWFLSKHWNELGGIGYFLGTWLNAGKVYFDIVIHVDKLENASRIGRENGQQAIFDCKNSEEIFL